MVFSCDRRSSCSIFDISLHSSRTFSDAPWYSLHVRTRNYREKTIYQQLGFFIAFSMCSYCSRILRFLYFKNTQKTQGFFICSWLGMYNRTTLLSEYRTTYFRNNWKTCSFGEGFAFIILSPKTWQKKSSMESWKPNWKQMVHEAVWEGQNFHRFSFRLKTGLLTEHFTESVT